MSLALLISSSFHPTAWAEIPIEPEPRPVSTRSSTSVAKSLESTETRVSPQLIYVKDPESGEYIAVTIPQTTQSPAATPSPGDVVNTVVNLWPTIAAWIAGLGGLWGVLSKTLAPVKSILAKVKEYESLATSLSRSITRLEAQIETYDASRRQLLQALLKVRDPDAGPQSDKEFRDSLIALLTMNVAQIK